MTCLLDSDVMSANSWTSRWIIHYRPGWLIYLPNQKHWQHMHHLPFRSQWNVICPIWYWQRYLIHRSGHYVRPMTDHWISIANNHIPQPYWICRSLLPYNSQFRCISQTELIAVSNNSHFLLGPSGWKWQIMISLGHAAYVDVSSQCASQHSNLEL